MAAGRALTYAAYLDLLTAQADQATAGKPATVVERIQFTRMNRRRTERIARTYRVSPVLAELLARIAQPQSWLALTEPWCGDSAQCLPYIAAMVQCNRLITFRLLLRDENSELMDANLTDGKRSIPLVIASDAAGRRLWRWGPRPAGAQAVFAAAQAAGLEKPQRLAELHRWYARDRGRTLEKEFSARLRRQLGDS